MAAKHKRPGSGRFPLACLDDGPPPAIHGDHYVWGTCPCGLCATWKERLDLHAVAAREVEDHDRSCMCKLCKIKRAALIQLLMAENIRDLWGEISWIAQTDGWPEELWTEWLMGELEDPARSPGWWASSASHMSMSQWVVKFEGWKKARGAE